MENPELYIGIMSGTSLDGIDVALLDFSGRAPKLIATHYEPYQEALRQSLLALHTPAGDELQRASLIANTLATLYADAVSKLLEKSDASPAEIRAIGCHGQTIRHRPEHGYTIQLGNGAMLAEISGITTINDFRSRDIAAGGQGAPLVPAFHQQLLRHPETHRVIVNIGGISNLTDLAPGKPACGFDCGPGNLLMDAWMQHHTGQTYDKNGALAASGAVLKSLLENLLQESYFSMPPPKSCGRDLFNLHWLSSKLKGNESVADVQATLLELTCTCIATSIIRHCEGAQEIYLCGGGAHNAALISRLQAMLPEALIRLTDDLGINADWLEAIAFAWLAKQTLDRHPANLPEVTGARHPCILGAIHQA